MTLNRAEEQCRYSLQPTPSAHINEYLPIIDTHRIDAKINANRGALGLAGAVVEAAIVLRAFDDVVHDQTFSEVDFLMGAKPIGRIVLAAR